MHQISFPKNIKKDLALVEPKINDLQSFTILWKGAFFKSFKYRYDFERTAHNTTWWIKSFQSLALQHRQKPVTISELRLVNFYHPCVRRLSRLAQGGGPPQARSP